MTDNSIDKSDYDVAMGMINRSRSELQIAQEAIKKESPSPARAISTAQSVVELSTKAVFILSGISFPESHELLRLTSGQDPPQNAKNIIYKANAGDFPEEFEYTGEIARILFLTDLWNQFYQPSKYPEQELKITPEDLFKEAEAELVIRHANDCLELADALSVAVDVNG